jgi:magnesium transporter
MIRSFVCVKNKILKDLSLVEIKKYLKDKRATIWVDLQKATNSEFSHLQETFNFHPLVMEDAKKSIELPKIDFFETYIFVVMHSIPHDFSGKYPPKREIDFFLGNNFLVTVHHHESLSVNRLMEKLERNHTATAKKADFLMYEIIDHFVDSYFAILDHWDDQIEVLESKIIAQKNLDSLLKEVLYIKREILYLKKSIAPQRDVINKISRRDFPFIHPLTSIYFRDIYDHLMRVYAELELQRDLISGAFEAYTSVLSNRLNVTSNKMNAIMQRLTVIATIFMPLTFFAGVYGMNFKFFPEINWKYGYLFFWSICLTIGITMYMFFKKRRWA